MKSTINYLINHLQTYYEDTVALHLLLKGRNLD